CYPNNNNATTSYETQPALTAAPSTSCSACGTITSITESSSPYGGGGYRVAIHLDNGQNTTIVQSTRPAFNVGDRVQILNQPIQ
ncbi:MAG TPA: hypothetical protein VFL97_01820, partial [Nitrococcus sp.]|nr:hypothetical protein [Nitrococcus sp.]